MVWQGQINIFLVKLYSHFRDRVDHNEKAVYHCDTKDINYHVCLCDSSLYLKKRAKTNKKMYKSH